MNLDLEIQVPGSIFIFNVFSFQGFRATFYFLALNSGPVISGNDISVYPVTVMGFVLRDFSKVFSHTFRLDMAELTLRAVINLMIYPIKNISKNVVFVLFLPHVFLQVGIKQVIRCAMHTPGNTKPISVTGYIDISLPANTEPEFNARN